jgi:hypothetical protein
MRSFHSISSIELRKIPFISNTYRLSKWESCAQMEAFRETNRDETTLSYRKASQYPSVVAGVKHEKVLFNCKVRRLNCCRIDIVDTDV